DAPAAGKLVHEPVREAARPIDCDGGLVYQKAAQRVGDPLGENDGRLRQDALVEQVAPAFGQVEVLRLAIAVWKRAALQVDNDAAASGVGEDDVLAAVSEEVAHAVAAARVPLDANARAPRR